MTSIIQSTDLRITNFSAIMSQYMQFFYANIYHPSLQRGMQRSMMNLCSSSIANAFQFDSQAFAGAMRLNMVMKKIS